jgi:hypothetical protein
MMFSKVYSTIVVPLLLLLLLLQLVVLSTNGQLIQPVVPCNICGNSTSGLLSMKITRYQGFVLSKTRSNRTVVRNCAHLYYMWIYWGAPSTDICTFVQNGTATKKNCGCVAA